MKTGRRIPALRRIVTLFCFCVLVWWPSTLAAQTVPSGFVVTPLEYWPDIAGLTFDDIGTMYVWERTGKVSIVENDVKRSTPLIDLSEEVGGWNDHGLLGFALHPNFRQNGYIYLMYVVDHHHLANFGTPSYNPNTNEFTRATIGRITRYTARASDNFRSVDPASRLVLLGETASTGCPILSITHGVGSLVFGTDGTLLASCGDGAMTGDSGSDPLSYYVNGLSEGIIRPKENIGAFRSQLIDSHSGKILRLDPATGDGVPSNPYYDPANPRAARSRVWNLGLRQPFRMTLKPGTGSHNPAAGDPGVLYLGDVGYSTWEALEVSTGPSLNFGWPVYEGLDLSSEFLGDNPENQDAPNPLYGINGCTQRYFRVRDLLVQATLATPSWPNPCNVNQQVPATTPHFVHTRPIIDWRHGSGPSRTGTFNGTSAGVVNIGAAGSPISGPQFGGNCAVGGSFYQGASFPATYQNSYFFADLGNGWIKNVTFDANGNAVSVRNFVDNAGGVTFVGIHPITGVMYYSRFWDGIHKVTYVGSGNQPPTAVASSNVSYGPSPRTVQFTGSTSSDPEGLPLTYLWDFGDGSPSSTIANPSHTYNAPAGVPTRFEARLTVTDSAMATSSATVLISVNNTPPSVAITTPPDGTLYPLGTPTTYALTAVVADSEHTDGQLLYQWQTTLHHNNHIHPDTIDTNHATSTVLTPIGCDGNLYFYRIALTVTDPAGLSGQDHVDVYPDCANTPPTISAIANVAIAQDSSTGPMGFTVSDAEIPVAFVTVTGSSSNTTLVPVANIVFGGSEGNRTVTVTPAANQSGTATITITASDGQLSANSAFVLTVNGATNTAPTISNILDRAVDLNTSTGSIAFTIGDAETAPGSLTLSGSSSNPTVVPNGNIIFGGSGANRTVTVTPAANQSGTATITITVSDGALSATDTFVLVVGAAPADFSLGGSPASQAVAPGGSANYGVTITPTGGFAGSVTLSVTGLPAGATGTFSVNPATASSTLTVSTSAATPTGTYTLTITGTSGSLTHTTSVTVSIVSGGGAPTSGQTAYLKFDESSGTTAFDSSLSNNTGTLVGGPVWNPAGRVNGALSFDGINDSVSLANQSLTVSFTLSAWVNVNSGSSEKTIFWVANRSFYINGNVLSYWNNGSTGSGEFGTVPTGSWQHITVTYSGSVLRAYLNGVQFPTTLTSTVSAGGTTRIGSSDGDNFFAGSIDEFRLYNRALSVQEVLDVYNDSGVPPAPDTESPSTPTGLGAAASSPSQINLSWTASTDNVGVAGYRIFRCQGAGCTPSVEIATSSTNAYANTGLAASTTYTYAVAAFDAASNASAASASASATTQAAADTTAPTVSVTAPANGAVVAGTAVTVSASASDNVGVSGVQFLLDGVVLGAEDTTAPYSITWDTTSTTSGLHTLSARARDAAGNTTTASNVGVTVDNQAPTGSIVINSGAAAVNTVNVTLTLSAADALGPVTQMRISNTTSFPAGEAYAATKAWTLSSGEGSKTVNVQFRDAAGNWSGTFSDTIVVDTTVPTGSSIAATAVTSGSATITWTTSEPANSQVEYGTTTSYGTLTPLDAALVTAHATPLTGLSPQTTYNYRVRSADAAGNQLIGTNQTFTTPAQPTMMIRYVNTASTAGGDGTTNGTAGANRAFRSLLDAINSLPDVLTLPVVVYCDGAGGPDTTPVDQLPFDMATSASNYLLITTDANNRAQVPHDPARYTLAATNSNVLYNNIPSHIRFDGIQVQLTITNGSSYVAVKTSNANQVATDIDSRISNLVVKCVVTNGNAIGYNPRFPAAGAGGSSVVFNSVAYGCTTGFTNDFVGAVYANNTAFDNDFGYVDDGGSMKVINSLAAKGSKAGSIGFIGTFAAGSDYNAEDDGNGAPGAHSRSGTTFTFVNAAISDAHLAPTDTGARDFGTSNPLPGRFSDDIDGTPRSGVWDIGADEAGMAPPDANPPSMPTGLSATAVSSSQINLAWTASTDDVAVTGYKIFRNGSQVGTSSTTSFSDTGLTASTTYTYAVSAYDAAGNNSETSSPAAMTTLPPPFDFALANGGSRSVARGSTVDNSITATLVSGATESVVFSTSGLPVGATASYAPSSCSPGCTTTMTITTTASTPLATSTITVTGTAGSLVRTTTFNLTVTSAPDTTAPTVALGASPANGSTVRATVTLSATASDNVGVVGVQFLLDGANLGAEDTTSPYSISWNTTTASNGPHTLSARARDAAGNTGMATVVSVTADNQAPTGTIVINGGAAVTNSRTATLTLAATDNAGPVSQMRFSNSGSSFSTAEAYATTKTWTLTSGAGTKTVYVQFRDAAGNWSSAAMTDTIILDTTAPTISSIASTAVTNASATITWITSEPATSQVEYGTTTSYGTLTALDSTLVTAHATPLSGLNPLTIYNYRVRSTDEAGNLRLGANRTFTTLAGPPDLTPPSAPTNLAAQAVSATQINLSWTASTDNVAVTGYRVFRNGIQIATVSTLTYASVNLTPNTSYTYTVVATDAGNNTSAPSSTASATTLPDTTLPTVSITSPANNATVFGTITVTASASDNASIAGVTFKVDGADIATEDTSSPFAVSLNTATLSDGSHTLTAVARDTSNNSATSASVVIVVDNTTPPSTMIRYVNTASTVGGDGTTNGTSGANRAFKSLRDAINSLPDVLTMPVVIYCDGAGGPDTIPVDQTPFDMVTSAANYLLVTTNAANRAKVPHDPTRYTLAATNSNVLYNNIPSHVRFDGLQVQLTITNGSSYVAVKTSNANQVATDIDSRISNTVVRCVVTTGGNAIGFHTRFPAAGSAGSSVVFNSVAYGCTSGFVNDFVGAVFANNTSFNNDFGYIDDDSSLKVINCLAAKGSKAGSIGFIGTFLAGSDYNAEDDGNGAPGANSRSGRTFTFVNAAISDVHLAPTDTGARDFGTSNPLPGKFTDDIDGILRSGLWDIGADEVGGGA